MILVWDGSSIIIINVIVKIFLWQKSWNASNEGVESFVTQIYLNYIQQRQSVHISVPVEEWRKLSSGNKQIDWVIYCWVSLDKWTGNPWGEPRIAWISSSDWSLFSVVHHFIPVLLLLLARAASLSDQLENLSVKSLHFSTGYIKWKKKRFSAGQ